MTSKQKTRIAVCILAVATTIACFTWWKGMRPASSAPTMMTYIDTETGKVEFHSSDARGPLLGVSGKSTVVRAFFFAPAAHPASKRPYYLLRETPANETVLFVSTGVGKPMKLTSHMQIRPAGGTEKDWVAFESPAGQEILREPFLQDATLIPCEGP